MITVKATVASRPSKVQNNNEDNFYFDGKNNTPEFAGKMVTHSYSDFKSGVQILAVFDGFGAEKSGGTASYLASELLKKFHKKVNEKTGADKSQFLTKYINDSHNLIKDRMKEQFGTRMGTTLSLLCIDNDMAYMFGVGDSRIYLYRDGTLKVLSEDHTQAQRMVNLGILKAEKARTHPQKEKLTQYLGILPEKISLNPWQLELNILENDIFIVCTDGMYDSIDDLRLSQLVGVALEPKAIAEYIIGEAFGQGGKDDVTVIVAKVYGDKARTAAVVTKGENLRAANTTANTAIKTTSGRKPANRTIWQTLTVFLLSLAFMITLSGFGFAKFNEYKTSLGDDINSGIFGQRSVNGDNSSGLDAFENNELDDSGNYPNSNDSGNDGDTKTKAPVKSQNPNSTPAETQVVTNTPTDTAINGTPGGSSRNSPSGSSDNTATPSATKPTASPNKTIEPLPS